MRTIGIDLGKVNSQMSERDEKGQELRNERFKSTREVFEEKLKGQPQARILLEASTMSNWVAKLLRQFGHEVVVADPNYWPMYINEASKRKKTDKRDASLLSLALFKGNWVPAHERSEEEQVRKTLIGTRAILVKCRTQAASVVRSTFTQYGITVPKCEVEALPGHAARLRDLLPRELRSVVDVQLKHLHALNKLIASADRVLEKQAKKDPRIRRLMTVPGVGPVVASAFVAIIDDPKRFDDAHQVGSFLGLVPSENSSGEKVVRGRITKGGSSLLRALLVQAGWSIWRSKDEEATRMKDWAHQLAGRRGSKKLAAVALARKLSGVLWAMWKNEEDFNPGWQPRKRVPAAA